MRRLLSSFGLGNDEAGRFFRKFCHLNRQGGSGRGRGEGRSVGGRVLHEINAFRRRLRDRLLKIFRASGETWSNKTLHEYVATLRALIVTV